MLQKMKELRKLGKKKKFQGKREFFKKNIKNFEKNLKKIDGECFAYGKCGHPSSVCCHRKKKSVKVNVVEAKEKIIIMVTEVNYIANTRDWVVDTGATKHIYCDRDALTSYKAIGDG